MVHRSPKFTGDDAERQREYYPTFTGFDPGSLEGDLQTVADAIESEVTFEPFRQIGDVEGLLRAAANLLFFIEEYEQRTGSLELPLNP